MKLKITFIFTFCLFITTFTFAQPAQPVFKDGEAQVVEAFNDPDKWIVHDYGSKRLSILTAMENWIACMWM
jgi:X-Pro dipeptidyl-peptidase